MQKSIQQLGWLVDHGIDPHIPVWNQSEVAPQGKFSRADFAYDKDRDLYICPVGKGLNTSGRVHVGNAIKYIAKKTDCSNCPLKPRCATSSSRRLQRDVHQQARDHTQALLGTEDYENTWEERKKIETLFGEVKHLLSRAKLRLRELLGAREEFLPIAAAQSFERLAHHSAKPPQPKLRR